MNEQKNSLRLLIVSGGIFASRMLGLLRDVVFAYIFGTGTALAAFVIAETFPNLLRGLFGEGAFANAMVPVFTTSLAEEGRESAWRGACRVISMLIAVISAIVAIAIVFSLLLRPWFQQELPRLTLALAPWLLPYAVLVCACAALAAVLNSLDRFALPAFSQTIMNASLVGAALLPAIWLTDQTAENKIWYLVGGVLLAGLIQLILHLRAYRRALMRFQFKIDFHDRMVAKVARLMAPAIVGVGVMQVNIVIDRILAGWLGHLATTSLYYSQRLIYLPVGLFGVAMGIVTLPMMSQAWARQDRAEMINSLRTAFRHVLFLTLPAVALFSALRYPLIELLFQRGDFTAESTAGTAWAMLFYLPGIPAFACAKIAVTPFYARHDTRTPVRVAVLCLVLNIVLNLILMQFLDQGGLALSTTICSALNVAILILLTTRQLGEGVIIQLLKPLAKMLVAAVIAFMTANFILERMPEGASLAVRLLRVIGPGSLAALAYLLIGFLLSCPEARELGAGLRRRPAE